KFLGRGTYGEVHKAQWNGMEIAVKSFKITADPKSFREVELLSQVTHDNIIQMYGVSSHLNTYYLLMEYMDGGSLSDFLRADKLEHPYNLAHAYSWSLQIAKGLDYLHGRKPKAVIHRDVKPSNSLLSQRGRTLKLCDFGTVRNLSLAMSTAKGTPLYMAPEVIDSGNYTEKCDVYSWSICTWEIMSRKRPFSDNTNTNGRSRSSVGGRRPLFDDDFYLDCPDNIKDLIRSCWDQDPKKRPGMKFVANSMQLYANDAGPREPLDYIVRRGVVLRP
ncbi:hypothetical protein KR018_007713, partial [Drosophila ironensis]